MRIIREKAYAQWSKSFITTTNDIGWTYNGSLYIRRNLATPVISLSYSNIYAYLGSAYNGGGYNETLILNDTLTIEINAITGNRDTYIMNGRIILLCS